MNYTDLIFDLYGTLVDIHTEENDLVWEKCAIFFGFCGVRCTGAELKKSFQQAMAHREAQAGQSYECFPDIPFEQVMSQLLREGGAAGNVQELSIQAAQLFRILSIEYIRLYPRVLEALASLRAQGFRLWLLSNAQQVFTAYELRHLGLDRSFDGIYLSSDYGCRKPDARFYRALLTEQKLDPSKCLMVGNDRQTDIAGAKALGIATLYMHTALTPADQAAADENRHPDIAPAGCRDYEYEGENWEELVPLIVRLSNRR